MHDGFFFHEEKYTQNPSRALVQRTRSSKQMNLALYPPLLCLAATQTDQNDAD